MWALVTGASAGIGKALCRVFAAEGFDVVLTARRQARLEAVAGELERDFGVKTCVISADLADPAAPAEIFAETERRKIDVAALVNNAGLGSRGYYREVSWADHAAFLQVLVTAVAHLTHLNEPGMTERRYGRIVNVASMAGLIPGSPGRTLYGAAKAFVVRFSEALAAEHAGDNVYVTAVCPGFTHSEFHDVAGTREQVSKLPDFMWMDADVVAEQAYEAVMAGVPLLVNGTPNKALAAVARLLPANVAWRLVARQAKGIRPKS